MRIVIFKRSSKITSVVVVTSDDEESELILGKDYEIVDDWEEGSDDEYDKWASEMGIGDLTLADLENGFDDFDWDDEDEDDEN